MKKFIFTLVVVILLGSAGYYYLLDTGTVKLEQPTEQLRTPVDYHLLQGLGGVPIEEATKAGLKTTDYAYLRSLQPIQIAPGIELPQQVQLGGKTYDLAYEFTSTRAQDQVLEFNLLGAWSELHFGFGFKDDEGSDPEGNWAIEISLLVDGTIVFGPKRLTPTDKPAFAKVDVSGANRVTFVSKRIGGANPFNPVLVDPFVRNAK